MSYPFLPVNPCCTDVVLNSPCGCTSTLPNTGCGQNPCETNVTLSSNVLYNGPALDCIIAEPCDTLNVVLQKIDEIICNLLTQINTLNLQVESISTQLIQINSNIITINNTLDTCCQVVTTTTTTTAAPLCTCIEIVIDADDIARATGNLDVDLNNVVFLNSPSNGAILCDGGTIKTSFNEEDAYKYCIKSSAFPLLQLYYYKDDFIVSEPDLESYLVNMMTDCSLNGDCIEPTTTTTTTVDNCNNYTLNNLDDFDSTYSYLDCDGLLVEDIFIAAFGTANICAQTDSVNFNSQIIDNGVCITTTTTTTITL